MTEQQDLRLFPRRLPAGQCNGATDWCSEPADLDIVLVRVTKNPDLESIRALRRDLVLANEEENRAPDLAALRTAGLPVWGGTVPVW